MESENKVHKNPDRNRGDSVFQDLVGGLGHEPDRTLSKY